MKGRVGLIHVGLLLVKSLAGDWGYYVTKNWRDMFFPFSYIGLQSAIKNWVPLNFSETDAERLDTISV